ncbi:MAG: hypothetical protein WDN08_03035 [Rhizomicrobium sp.]
MSAVRTLLAPLALAALFGTGAAAAPACPGIDSAAAVEAYGWNVFFAKTSFGTVGFKRDDANFVYVPRVGVTCVSLPQPHAHLYIVFNHRHSEVDAVGYVSFKLYGLTRSPPLTRARALIRRGGWHRDPDTRLPGELWAPAVQPAPDESAITRYEAFYGKGAGTIGAFDAAFGPLHGTPDGSDQYSWDGRFGMQPDDGPVDLSRVGYLRHELQRVAVAAQAGTPGDPPMIETHQFQYASLLASVASPLGEGTQRTILFKFH